MARRRVKPADPQTILLRRAEERARERQAAANPGEWGVNAQVLTLPANEDISARRGGQQIFAQRLDAFDALKARRGLSDHQHTAANRLVKDWAIRIGVRTDDSPQNTKVDGGAQELVNDRMLAAGRRIDNPWRPGMDLETWRPGVFQLIGRADVALLTALVEPIVLARAGVTTWWRGAVQTVTGETDTHAQGAAVRRACENLRLAYEDLDSRPLAKRALP